MLLCWSCLSFLFPVSLISSAVSHWSHRLHVRVNISFNIIRDTRKVSETWICTPVYPISHVGSTRMSLYLRVQFLYIALANQEMEETCDNIMLFHFIFFSLCIYVLLYLIMSWCRYAVQLWKVGDTCFSDSQEQGWWIMEYAPFKQKTNLMFGEVRTLNLHCGIEVAKQRGVSYWCYVTTRTATW